MTIEPDTKNWTWVLEAPCPDCRFVAAEHEPTRTGAAVRAMLPAWTEVLSRPDASERRDPRRWSDLEYGCHVRDVFVRFDARVERMLTEDAPRFENWDQDASAIEDCYAEQDPLVVAGELSAAGERIAERFDAVTGDQWDRIGIRSDGATFSVASLARYFLHDPVHHLWDVGFGKP